MQDRLMLVATPALPTLRFKNYKLRYNHEKKEKKQGSKE